MHAPHPRDCSTRFVNATPDSARCAGAWVLVEVVFFAVQRWRYRRLNRVNAHAPSAHDVDARIRQFLSLREFVDIHEFISGARGGGFLQCGVADQGRTLTSHASQAGS